jgi:betaine-aldehyde dehydrogenase
MSLELGGKSPLIVREDADLERAADGAIAANFYTQGEICSNGTRVFVHEKVKAAFTAILLEKTKNLVIGDPLDPKTTLGALISAAHREKVLSYIQSGQADGATLLYGGTVPKLPDPFQNGFFLMPTIFTDCHDEMKIVREEIFGPVLSLLSFQSDDEVLARANQTEFGLAAGVYTRDVSRAQWFAERLEAGIVWINSYNLTPVEVPFGGTKKSGFGRENGWDAFHDYTQVKTVYLQL